MNQHTPVAADHGVLSDALDYAARYLDGLEARPVAPPPEAIARLQGLGGPMPEAPSDPREVLALLDDLGSPATVASAGPRYFGYVIGGALPATVAANWLATAWDQCGGLRAISPTVCAIEEIVVEWLSDLLGLPSGCASAFVTGASMASFTALAAARHAVLARAGWDVQSKGLYGAPPIRIVVGEEVHVTVLKALGLLGLGRDTAVRVPVDGQGRMRADALPPLDERTILCLQAGNVNTGAFDPAADICARAREAGAWTHVDGAFGLWAAAAPARKHLMAGFELADSWATDGHKQLNTPYDCGIALVRHPEALRDAMAATAAYLAAGEEREPTHYGPELSRRARAVEVWAALRSLGRSGVAELVERCCRLAERFADGLQASGFEVLNEVAFNQVLVSFGSPERTQAVISALQAEGTAWFGGSVWQGRTVMRISVSNWSTTERDVDMSLEAIRRIAASIA